jgi:archaemetzincin
VPSRPTRRTLLNLGLAMLGTAAAGSRAARAAGGRRVLYLQPLGADLPAADVALVKTALEGIVGIEVGLLAREPLPAAAFYRPRRRYRADGLLDFLDRRLPPDGVRILGLTGADISTTKGSVFDWGVLGLGRIDGASCVISEFRCRMKSNGPAHARERLAKVAVHEIGHTLGLPHCPTRGCLMEDAEGQVATCDREYDFCELRCRPRLAAAGRALPRSPTIPWPRPAPAERPQP